MPEESDHEVSGVDDTVLSSDTPTDVRRKSNIEPITTKHKASLIGHTVGGAHIDEFIGRGGMSEVYHGVLDSEEVVVKILQLQHMKSESTLRRFEEDAKATAALHHPHIVEIIATGNDEGTPYIINKFVKGKDGKAAPTLGKIHLSLEQSAQGLLQIAKALNYAHSTDGKLQILHRDVKPDNIIVQTEPLHLYLIDFGLAKIVDESRESVTQNRDVLGTADYMSPEQAADAKDVGPKSDIYSWACTAYAVHSRTRPREQRHTTVLKPLEEQLRTISIRMNDQITHELLLNEAIDEGFKDLTSGLDPVKDKASIDGIRKKMGRVNDKYEEDIARVLWGKKLDERPSFSMLIPRLEDRIKKNQVRERELTPEEKGEQDAYVQKLQRTVAEIKEDLGKSSEKFEKTYRLGLALTALADELPCADDSREALYKEALDHLSGVYAQMDIAQRSGQSVIIPLIIPLQEIDDYKSWAASGVNVIQERKNHFESRLTEQQYEEMLVNANKALDEKRLSDAVEFYTKIDHAKVPNVSKTKLTSLTKRFEDTIESILEEGAGLVEKDVDAAEKQYENAKILGAVLPKEGDCAKYVEGFKVFITYTKNNNSYKNAEKEGDFYNMLKLSGDMLKQSENPLFPSGKKDECGKLAATYQEALKSKTLDISILEQLIISTGGLIEERSKALPTDDSQTEETSIRSLSQERIDYFNTNIADISKKFGNLPRENIGPKYDELKTSLDFFREDVQVEIWKRGVGKDDIKEKYACLKSLIEHFREKDDKPNERFYLQVRMSYDRKRLEELGK